MNCFSLEENKRESVSGYEMEDHFLMDHLLRLVMSTTYESHSLGEWRHLISYQDVDADQCEKSKTGSRKMMCDVLLYLVI